MEIKVLCGCGAKYKFDVEPVQGRMPYAVRCPVCSVDGTTQANWLISQQSSAPAPAVPVAILLPTSTASTPAAPAPGPVAMAVPVATPVPVSAPPPASPPPPPPAAASPAPARVALRVGGASAAGPSTAEAAAAPAAPYEGPFPLRRGTPIGALHSGAYAHGSMAGGGGVREVKLGFKVWAIILVLLALFIGWPIAKMYWRYKRESLLAGVFKDDSKRNSKGEEAEQRNFLASDNIVIVVRHTNDNDVAQACADFWRDRLRRKLTVVPMKEGLFETGQIGIKAPHQGWVEIEGPPKWPKPQAEALLTHLAQKFNSTAVIMAELSDGDEFLFGVYETGQKKFRAESSYKRNDGDTVTEGREWVTKLGFKPEEDDWTLFDSDDADTVMKKMGMKLWGRPDLSYSFMLKQ